jgi:hypothetical protein
MKACPCIFLQEEVCGISGQPYAEEQETGPLLGLLPAVHPKDKTPQAGEGLIPRPVG